MIVYYMSKIRTGSVNWGRHEIVRKFVGTVHFYDESRSRAMKLGTGTTGRPLMIFRATVFDDATEPPTLVRADYGFGDLENRGATLPIHYTDSIGNIRRTKDDEIVMEGPNGPAPHSWPR